MMQANELASLRSDISELKLQRQELRQLNAYRAAEAANAKDQAMGAQARANQLMRVVEELRTNEAKLQEEAKRAGEEIARLKKDLEDERKTKQEALGEKDSEIIGLKARLRRAEAEAAESRKKCKELEAKVKAEVRGG
ncbi:hypothetical protein NMY22_g968 [Coprinellus aureogranulatus]|nr:hypothetical protein NMY22_g968 [Coprinellus aureogranulatus]